VSEAIERGETDQTVVEKLRLATEIKTFAVENLGLPDNDSYSEYVETGRDAVVWNVVAAPEFSLDAKKWCFPVSGCVPYRGYFKREAAQHFADKLGKQGLEVAVSPAIAYSTLGWFDDPLLDTMWRHSDAQFAAYIFHELAHQALYIKGDTAFNESYASFVELIGVEQWLLDGGQRDALDRWLAMTQARKDFNALLQQTREALSQVYGSQSGPEDKRAGKQAAFAQLETRYRQVRDRNWQSRDYFGQWFEQAPNNARFALLDSY
jgi:predicted aminopeptidase